MVRLPLPPGCASSEYLALDVGRQSAIKYLHASAIKALLAVHHRAARSGGVERRIRRYIDAFDRRRTTASRHSHSSARRMHGIHE